ncbi:MAG: ABC transporter permease [Planctomycetota bacterium]|nr:MAG: ABC transporter permease [Planctomycetota bacterium]
MIRYLLRKLALAPLVLFVLVTISFFLMRAASGGPFDGDRGLDPEIEQAIRDHFRLDDPLFQQYLYFLGGLLRGDLGPSFNQRGVQVSEIIATYLPVSIYVGLISMILALFLGMAAGIWAAMRHNRWQDQSAMTAALIGLSVPAFVTGPLLMMVFSIALGWLPVAGWNGYAGLSHLILPATCLALPFAGRIARLARTGMLEVIHQDYIRTARALGLAEHQVILHHALRGACVPVAGFLGPAIASLVTGSLVVEMIFQIPGLGREFVLSAFNRDYTLVMGTVIVYGAVIIIANLLADLLLAWLDPRVRLS